MVQQLSTIYPHINKLDDFLRNLTALSKDTDPYVRACVIASIGQSFKLPEMKTMHGTFLTLIKKAVKQAFVTGDMLILQEFTKFIGEMARVLSGLEIATQIFITISLSLELMKLPKQRNIIPSNS
jgi:hypothetical protein